MKRIQLDDFFAIRRLGGRKVGTRDLRWLALLMTASLLISCGGGGGGSSTSATSADVAAATAAASNAAADTAASAAAAASDAAAIAAAATAAAAAANTAATTAAAAAANAAAATAASIAAAATAAANAAAAAAAAAAATAAAPIPTPSTLVLNLPKQGLLPSELAVIVAQGDANSEAIASYYITARGIPAANVIRVTVPTGSDSMSSAAFTTLKASIDAQLPSNVQATLLTWSAPSRVTGSCTMSITSAMAFGFDSKYCFTGTTTSPCQATTASSYYDSESAQPLGSYNIRPSMMLGANTLIGTTTVTNANALAAAKSLIDRGVSADASYPNGDGYLLRTSDVNRNVRYADYSQLTTLWPGSSGLKVNYLDNSAGASSDTITGQSNVLFYFTGLTNVSGIASNTFRPGAAADHLTSFGGYLPTGNGQMPITAWLAGGATASYGTVEEPCNYTEKFSKASVLIDHYYRGDTLIEAYWKSVQWPGEGLFVGEPLSQPFRNASSFAIVNGAYVINTRGMRTGSHYSLQYRIAPSTTWITLKSFVGTSVQASTLSAPLPPSNATHIQWVGPCPSNSAQQCTLSSSS